MIIGIPKEVMDQEYRVGLTPSVCSLLTARGHQVLLQASAGEAAGHPDAEYVQRGVRIAATASQVWEQAALVVKVKQPLSEEYHYLRPGLAVYCFLHLAAEPELSKTLLERRVSAVAAETIQTSDGALPALAPMSEIAGKMTLQISAHYLSKPAGGIGKLLSGVVGVPPAKVVVVGGGSVGTAAARMALGIGAEVTVLDRSHRRLVYLQENLHGNLVTMLSNEVALGETLPKADVVVGAVLVPGAKAPSVVTRDMVKTMQVGAVIIDVSIDQGGCIETSHPTHHSNPTYVVDGVVHYSVVNMPGAVPRTASQAFAAASYPYIAEMAELGLERAALKDPALALGINTYQGKFIHPAVAAVFGERETPLQSLLGEKP